MRKPCGLGAGVLPALGLGRPNRASTRKKVRMPSLNAQPSNRRTPLLVLAAVFAAGIALIACQGANNPSGPSVAAAPAGPTADASRGVVTASAADKFQICHDPYATDRRVMTVNKTALAAHLAHGDNLYAQVDVCGDGIDNNCDGNVDVGCVDISCPCRFNDITFDSAYQECSASLGWGGQIYGTHACDQCGLYWINYAYQNGGECNAHDAGWPGAIPWGVHKDHMDPAALAACARDFATIYARVCP